MIISKHLSVSYDNNLVLEDINLRLEGSGIIGILGPNGAGKSTLMKALLGLVDSTGESGIGGDLLPLMGRVAYVEQKTNIDYQFPITVGECVSLGLYKERGLFKRLSKTDWEKVSRVIDQVGLRGFENRPINALSGGQFQRMLMARCLVQEADYIFLDEPFVGIDSISEQIIVNLLKKLSKSGKLILVVHHDLSKVDHYFDQVIILNRHLIACGPIDQAFTRENLSAAYGDAILLGQGD
ncbi:TPA: metal ABC transporter ATP-binding protein [Streptococcus agalactiae]